MKLNCTEASERLSDLIVMGEHKSLLLACSEAEAGVEVVADTGDVGQIEVQVALTGEMSLSSHLHEHTQTSGPETS